MRVTPALLEKEAKNMSTRKTKIEGVETAITGVLSDYNAGSGVIADTAHQTVDAALQTAKGTWTESFRLSKRELELLHKILDKVGKDCDLLDSELTYLARNQG